MVVLTGKNLGERHRELNYKAAEVIANNKNLNDINIEEEATDVDKLYKIVIASKYKDVDYIVEVLKSGDTLYISRALKCQWLYHDNYSHIVNAENLHNNIFPFMSLKMKKRMLSTISMHIGNYDHAANYFIYCHKNGMPNIALKFLNFSSEEFKLDVLRNKQSFNLYLYFDMETKLKNFVGNSFVLAATCIEMYDGKGLNLIHNLKYLYAIDSEKYLDILEKYEIANLKSPNALDRLGIRISRDVMLKHKIRVLKNPLLYVNKLNKRMLVKYSSSCEAKKYIISLFPQCVTDFWQIDFCAAYYYILNLIPISEKFEYIKRLFTTNYPGEEFEMSIDFYQLKYYNMFSVEQRELWALRHINEQKEILGNGNDYIWYKFVNIDKTFIEINKYIMVTPDRNKRSCIVNILVEAARDQEDLKKVLNYYYNRHVNEIEQHKNNFIDKILTVHNVFEFNIECWEVLNKLFYSLDIYSVGKYTDKVLMAVAVVCHILHNIKMPQALIYFVDLDVNYSYFSVLLDKLGKEKSEIVLQYLLKLFIEKLEPFEQDPHNKKLRKELIKYVNNIYNLLKCFQKEDEECPKIVRKFMDIHSPKTKQRKTVTAKDIFRFIKSDATLVVDALSNSDLYINDCRKIVNSTLRKLKVYFQNDVAQEYINFLDRKIEKCSDDYDSCKVIDAAIFGLFQLGDENLKVSLLQKYHPLESKIDHSVIDRKLLYIQEAICRYVGYSRPPVPLKNVIQYIKGDYVHYCLPMFNMYLVNLPLPLMLKFIESILNAPLSIQKHGLRLAFECYTSESLKTLLMSTWKKSKNVSLRRIIYKSLFSKLTEQTSSWDDVEHARTIFYEVLKFFTSDLHQDDHEDIFEFMSSYHCRRLPNIYIDDYLQTAWRMVIQLPKKSVNIDRQINVIRSIEENIKLVQRDFVRQSVIDEHFHELLEHRSLRPDELDNLQVLWQAKWNLTANYIVKYRDDEELEESLALVSFIFKKCVEMWNDRYKETYIFQKFYLDFITYIEDKSYILWYNNSKESCSVSIFKHILDISQETLPLKEIYLTVWNLKLIICLGISLNVTNTILYDRDGNSKPLSQEEILSDNIANHLEIFIRDLLDKHQFYSVFLPEIAKLIKCKYEYVNGMKNLDIYLSQSLANIGLKETHLIALLILPTDVPEEMRNIYSRTLQKIQAFENEEIQCFLHFKCLSPYDK